MRQLGLELVGVCRRDVFWGNSQPASQPASQQLDSSLDTFSVMKISLDSSLDTFCFYFCHWLAPAQDLSSENHSAAVTFPEYMLQKRQAAMPNASPPV